ncbi:MAG TPA: cytochrome C [Campylobacterales bacterium]|nr:cytochrome C [Campylobacterales bacterium]
MKTIVKVIAVASLLTPAVFADNTAACKGCHGANFEKEAMGKSKIVKDMSQADIVKALKGYKDGSYKGGKDGSGSMATVMKGQVATLDDAAIEAIAAAIKK